MKPKVSIIIPVYNGEKTVRESLESVLTQSLREIEVLCINDGSTDGTAAVLREMAAGDSRVRLYGFEKNHGIVLAVKTGLLEARGDYVMFVDADDILLPGAIENAVRLIEQYDVDILQFAIRVKHPKGANIGAFMKSLQCLPMESSGAKILYDCFCMHRFPHNVYTKIYRSSVCRTAAENMPDIELKQFTDLYLSFFFLYFAKTFRSVVEGPYYEYRFLGAGVFSAPPTALQFEQMCATSEILPLIEEFLRDRHEYAARKFLVDSIGVILRCGVLDKLMGLPEITAETIELAMKNWGSDLLYDFIRETGLLDVPCANRYGMVTKLAEENRRLRNNQTTITISNTKGI